MKAIILNSGLGHRMGDITKTHPKCMTPISETETILSRQLTMLAEAGVTDVVMTTGYYDTVLTDYCDSLHLPLSVTFVKNPLFDKTNYIYSLFCARAYCDESDVLLMHGDLVFENRVLDALIQHEESCVVVSSSQELPQYPYEGEI